jgi:hypothetical protein
VFVQTLQSLPGGLPNLHIAVVSSDMGAGPEPSGEIQHCALGGDQGIFQAAPRGTCTATGLQPGQTFISNVGGIANYTGTLESVFSCIALLGDQGCGFEHQLKSVLRALGADGNPPPAENAGFLRPDALLAIILVTNEDDCSGQPTTQMYTSSSRFIADPWGPLTSFRCNEFGHLCGGARPPLDSDVILTDCHSAEGQGELLHIADIATQLRSLKSDPAQIFVTALTGPPVPYHVTVVPSQQADPAPFWPQIDHSCVQSSGEFADPAIRIAELLQRFGPNGMLLSVCAPSFAPAFQQIVGAVAGPTPHCLAGSTGAAPICTATLGGTMLPACPAASGTACFSLRANPICPFGSDVVVQPNGATVDPAATVILNCS